MSRKTRHEVINALRQDYSLARTRMEKGAILDRLVSTLGVHRKYAIAAMAKSSLAPQGVAPARRRYGPEVRAAVVALWESSGQLCSRRLVSFLPALCEALERHGHLSLPPETRRALLAMGHATVDRILAAVRYGSEEAARTKRHRAAELRRKIPIRTFSDWAGALPGECSTDLVAHCGQVLEGSFLWSLVVTDVVTGWTEPLGLLVRDANAVLVGLDMLKESMPAGIIALHTDNGSEFINAFLAEYCRIKAIKFTRGRPYRKNDQCFIEQKNGHVVRRHIGYDRLQGVRACALLNEMYALLRLHTNFFQPCMKLEAKIRDGSRVVKRYEPARTPYQRSLDHPAISGSSKSALTKLYLTLDPVILLRRLQECQKRLFELAGRTEPSAMPVVSAALTTRVSTVVADPVLSAPRPACLPPPFPLIYKPFSKSRPRRYKKSARWHAARATMKTRRDPFCAARLAIEETLDAYPDMSAKALLAHLQATLPEEAYPDGLLRTLQRRVRAWRAAQVSAPRTAYTGLADAAGSTV